MTLQTQLMPRTNLSRATRFASVLLCLATSIPVIAQTFDLSWNTIDGGGAMNSAGGTFAVSGTIGQPDAHPAPVMTGGSFQLAGGFWPGIGGTCAMPGDMNSDGSIDGDDVQLFINCIIAGTGSCGCADLDGNGLGAADVPLFVAAILGA